MSILLLFFYQSNQNGDMVDVEKTIPPFASKIAQEKEEDIQEKENAVNASKETSMESSQADSKLDLSDEIKEKEEGEMIC